MEAMEEGTTGNASTQHGITGQQLNCTQMIGFTGRHDIPGIYLDIPCIYEKKVTCQRGPALLPTLVWQPQTGTSFGSSRFWPQRGRPREAGAVQSSTTRC